VVWTADKQSQPRGFRYSSPSRGTLSPAALRPFRYPDPAIILCFSRYKTRLAHKESTNSWGRTFTRPSAQGSVGDGARNGRGSCSLEPAWAVAPSRPSQREEKGKNNALQERVEICGPTDGPVAGPYAVSSIRDRRSLYNTGRSRQNAPGLVSWRWVWRRSEMTKSSYANGRG